MEKTAFQNLENLAKGELVQTMAGPKVDMANPQQVRQAQVTATNRASQIRAASPKTPMLPKSMKKKEKCDEEDAKKSTSIFSELEELGKSLEKSRFPGSGNTFSSSQQKRGYEKAPRRLGKKKFGAHRRAGHFRNPLNQAHKSAAFDLDAFNKENPVYEGDDRAVSLKTADKRISGPSSARKQGADEQANRMKMPKVPKKPETGSMKMASTAKKAYQVLPPGKAQGSISPTPTIPRSKPKRGDADAQAMKMKSHGCPADKVKKSLDPTQLPRIGSPARAKYEANYYSWKPKPKPEGYKHLSGEEVRNMNSYAAAGHKEAMHQLLDDAHFRKTPDKK